MPGLLSNRVALVTGAGRGIGRGIAMKLADEGASVIVNGVTAAAVKETAELISMQGGAALPVVADVASESAVDQLIAEAVSWRGRLDIVVNNAGVNCDAMFHEMTVEQWDEVLSVNLKGPWLVTKAAAPHLRRNGYGRIVMIGSEGGTFGNIGMCNYVAAKAGLMGLTMAIAREMAKWAVADQIDLTCNLIMPGFNVTRMTDGVPDAIREKHLRAIPLGRPANSREEIGSVVAFLASPGASYVTGAKFSAGGGLHMNLTT